MQKTTIAKKEIMKANRKWFIIDATDKVLGDLAVVAANILRGKNKPEFTPHVDCGDYLIITNAEKVKLTGKKVMDKKYYRHSRWIGHLKEINVKDRLIKEPEGILEDAIQGMVPKGPLGRSVLRKLFVYKGQGKDHSAQKPEVINL